MSGAGYGGQGAEIDAFLVDLARWTADTRASDAAGSRVRERWLRHQAAEDARFVGVLVDLAEQGAGVAVRTTASRTLQGRIAAVAGDFCVVRHEGGMVTLVTFATIASVRPEPDRRTEDAGSSRTPGARVRPALSLAEVLARLAPERPRLRIVVEGGGEALAGELRSVGADVATLRLEGDPPARVYVQIGCVREVTLL
ncbi:MAG TPA: hypothetical protein VMZ73_00665 [Acidimicrobiales bacterium]|nr:hypothetical protein [Acidimicrobiales bacterium]